MELMMGLGDRPVNKNAYRMYSEALGMEITVTTHFSDVSVQTADGVNYLPGEIRRLKASGADVIPSVHFVKKLFEGEIREIRC